MGRVRRGGSRRLGVGSSSRSDRTWPSAPGGEGHEVPINRPDRPLRSVGAEDRGRAHHHPDPKADLRERSDGAHAEFVTPPEADPGQVVSEDADEGTTSSTSPGSAQRHDAPSESSAGAQGPGDADGPALSPGSPQTDADPGPRGPRFGAVGIAIVAVLMIPALIYLAMITGVFTVGG